MYAMRKAKIADVPQIYELLRVYAEAGLMLPRSLSDLYDVIRDFHVASPFDRSDRVAGMCALHIFWEDLAEIRSLGVSAEHRGADLGRQLLDCCIAEARQLGLARLFVLTYIPKYFVRMGFKEIEKIKLPQKIWADCFKCVKFPECGEVAMELGL